MRMRTPCISLYQCTMLTDRGVHGRLIRRRLAALRGQCEALNAQLAAKAAELRRGRAGAFSAQCCSCWLLSALFLSSLAFTGWAFLV